MKQSDNKKENRIIITGVILAAAVIAACIIGYFALRDYITEASNRTESAEARLSDEMLAELEQSEAESAAKAAATETPQTASYTQNGTSSATVTVWPDTQLAVSQTPTPTPTPTEEVYEEETAETETVQEAEPVTAYVATISDVDTSGYQRVGVAYASATSTIVQEGIDNSAIMMFDSNDTTSWQEGAAGYGEGESIYVTFDRQYQIRYISFKLGNWRDASNWAANGRPASITLWIAGAGYQMSFADSMTEYCLVLSRDITASEMTITLGSSYTAENEDTCISEVSVYGY